MVDARDTYTINYERKGYFINEDESDLMHLFSRKSFEHPSHPHEQNFCRADLKLGGHLVKANPSINGSNWIMLMHLDMKGKIAAFLVTMMNKVIPKA